VFDHLLSGKAECRYPAKQEDSHALLTSNPLSADAVCRSALLAHLIQQIQNGMRQRCEFRESDPPLHLPPLEPPPELFILIKLINEFLIAL
jgi:hypothetical protein